MNALPHLALFLRRNNRYFKGMSVTTVTIVGVLGACGSPPDVAPDATGGLGAGAIPSGGIANMGGSTQPSGGASGGAPTTTSGGTATSSGGAMSGGQSAEAGGAISTSDGGAAGGGAPSDALPPPNQCINQYFVDGCIQGDATSACGGNCQPPSAGHAEGKPGEPGYMCPRALLFGAEMTRAAEADAARYGWGETSPFAYAVAGHDNDGGLLDDSGASVCCTCFQLIPYLPNENQVVKDGKSAVPLPKPLIVQVFNTGATTTTFDLFLGAGGIGAVNACMDPAVGAPAFYSSYPATGQPFDGGVKAVGTPGNGTACKDSTSNVTVDTLGSAGCQQWVSDSCNQIDHANPSITASTRDSCIRSNDPTSLYHLNWKVYAKRVTCPLGITEVTGCRLNETESAVDPNAIDPTSAQASGFIDGYTTTTMQDCAKPTCAAKPNVVDSQHTADGLYNSIYTCNSAGVPWTEPEQ